MVSNKKDKLLEDNHTDNINYGMADTFMSIFGLRRLINEWVYVGNKNVIASMFADETDIVYVFKHKKKKSELVNASELINSMKYSKFKKMKNKWKPIILKGKIL